MTLICNTTGGPATNVTWTRDGEVISTAGDTYQKVIDLEYAVYLNILTLTSEAFGNYTCRVSNARSFQEESITVESKSL